MKFPKKVTLCEVGPRDGLQNECRTLTAEQKTELVDACTEAGFPVIEVGSFVHPKAVPQMATTDEVFFRIKRRPGVEYRGFAANMRGVSRAIECGCSKIKLNVSASLAHNIANLNCTPAESVARFGECAELAREKGLGVSGSISMAFGSPWEHNIPLSDVEKIIEAYLAVEISEISLSDASGMATPHQVWQIFDDVQKAYPEVVFWAHFHNTRGLAAANMLAAMDAGISRFDTAFAGCGGCPFVPNAAGNISSEDVVHMLSEMGIDTGVDPVRVIQTGRMVEKMTGHAADSYVLRAGRNEDLVLEMPQKREKK